MQLTDIQIDRFGVLDHVSVEKLSHRVTVFWGPNGSGKSTLVRFLRGLFFGYQRNIPWTQADLHTESGFARIQTAAGQRTLRRQWSMSNIEQFTLTDQVDREVVSGSGNSLPAWVTEDIFREVFTVGYEEAERFELLTRLCMESGGGRNDTDSELRQAEAALIQTIRDRDGNGVQGGVVHRISELRGRQSHLQTEIANLRRPAADLPAAIEQLHREIDAATQNIEQIDTRIRDIDSEITRLDQLLIELRRCNVLPLNHQAIEGEIRTVLARLDRWQKIRGLIERETEARRSSVELQSSPEASLRTIRAIISRLEERVQALTD
ncbi:MAG TPA: AAA family ATPase [Planctomycetaceae bacterium]|nr:AAA family ATPase [Planctomycetaceae bacterium]